MPSDQHIHSRTAPCHCVTHNKPPPILSAPPSCSKRVCVVLGVPQIVTYILGGYIFAVLGTRARELRPVRAMLKIASTSRDDLVSFSDAHNFCIIWYLPDLITDPASVDDPVVLANKEIAELKEILPDIMGKVSTI